MYFSELLLGGGGQS